jgi:terminal uridylyltransferase
MGKPKHSQDNSVLEQELRSMILSNVRIADETPATTPDRRAPGYRGRGAFHNQHPNVGLNRFQPSNEHRPFTGDGAPVASAAQGFTPSSPRSNHFHSHGGQRGSYSGGQQYEQHSHHRRTQPGRGRGFGGHHQVQQGPDGVQPQIYSRGNAPFSNNHHQKPQGNPAPPPMAAFIAQCEHLDQLAAAEIPPVEMSAEELSSKEALREKLELICQGAMKSSYPDLQSTIHLQCYGSLVSGFATKGSDVDMTIRWSGPSPEDNRFLAELPRILERAILDAGHGARLLSKTRVPILKICERPTEDLFNALNEERQKWEGLADEEKYPSLAPQSPVAEPVAELGLTKDKGKNLEPHDIQELDADVSRSGKLMDPEAPRPRVDTAAFLEQLKSVEHTEHNDLHRYCRQFISSATRVLQKREIEEHTACQYFLEGMSPALRAEVTSACKFNTQNGPGYSFNEVCTVVLNALAKQQNPSKPWVRDRARGPLDFPKSGVGIQCDINFSNLLGTHNTQMLRCYSRCDPRVRPMVLFVKAWAKRRKINSAYSGTLSSYGYVLMVLHFLVHVVRPPVVPNLQQVFGADQREVLVNGYNISFWNDEQQIQQLAAQRQLTQNTEPLGVLLRNFFHYFAAQGPLVAGGGFNWMKDVLSLRTPMGILSKEGKGWTGAKTVTVNNVSLYDG